MLHNICNMCSRDLPDMSALALGRCVPAGSCIHIRQIPPAHVTYITYKIYIYSRTSIIRTPVCHLNVKGVQINEFVQISELSDKIHYLAS